MNNRKKSILIYLDNAPMVTALPPEQRGWLFTALLEYGSRLSEEDSASMEQVTEQFPQMDTGTQLVFGFMASNIFRDTRRWLSRKESRESFKKAPAAREPDRQAVEDMERTRRLMERLREE